MTRDDRRDALIEAIAEAATISIRRATAAFDALHGIARVCAVESTSDMRIAGGEAQQRSIQEYGDPEIVWDAMSTAGDLTNPPEKKP